MSLNKFDRDLDLLAELIHKTGHIEGNNTVIQFDHLIEISFETEGIGDSKIQHPWARGVSVPTIEEYEGQMSGEAVHVEFDRIFPLKFADIKQFRASFAQLDDETVKMLWDEALKGDQIDEDDSDPEPAEEDENNMKNETIDASKIKACPKCGAVNVTFNHPSYDGGSYVSCCNCNYAPQEETWADSDWEALKRWNDLPREEAPYNCEDTEETAKDEKTQKMSTKDLIDDLVKDKMSEDQVLREHSCMDEDEFYIRDYIHTFGSRYAKNFWAIKFAAPIDLSNGETAAGIGFHGRGELRGIGGYDEEGGLREFYFWMLNEEDKQALADQLPFGNCGLFAFERHEPSDIEEESMFHKSPETIRKYIRDNGHVPKGQLCPACKFKEPVKIHLRYKETATAIGMSCPKETNGGPWVLLDCDSSKCGAPEVDLSQLVDSDKFKCCDQLTQGDAGEFDWESIGPMEKEPEGDFAPDCCPIEKMDIHPEDKENAIRARERDMKVYPLFDPRPDEDPNGVVDVPDEVNEKNKTLLLTYGTPSEYGDIYTILLDDPELTKPLKVTTFYAKCAVDGVYYKKSIDKVCVKLHGVKAEDIALNGLNHPDWEAVVKEMWVSVAGRLFQGYCAMKAANNHDEPDLGQNNYLHVETPEIRIKHGDVLTDANGSKWMVNCKDDPAVQFIPLYRVCEQVTQDGNNTSFVRQIVTELPDDEEVRAEGENSAADYDANDLGLITQNAIEEDLAKLKPIVANMLQECIKHAKNQQLSCEVSVDLGGRNSLANKKAEKIEGILKDKGFVEVKWHYGDGTYFKENVHVFFIRWRVPDKTQATLHQ